MHIGGDAFAREPGPVGQGKFRQQFRDFRADHDAPRTASPSFDPRRVSPNRRNPPGRGLCRWPGMGISPSLRNNPAPPPGFRSGRRRPPGPGIDSARDEVIIQRLDLAAGNVFRAGQTHRGADVGQHQLAGHIADRPDPRDVCRHPVIDQQCSPFPMRTPAASSPNLRCSDGTRRQQAHARRRVFRSSRLPSPSPGSYPPRLPRFGPACRCGYPSPAWPGPLPAPR